MDGEGILVSQRNSRGWLAIKGVTRENYLTYFNWKGKQLELALSKVFVFSSMFTFIPDFSFQENVNKIDNSIW